MNILAAICHQQVNTSNCCWCLFPHRAVSLMDAFLLSNIADWSWLPVSCPEMVQTDVEYSLSEKRDQFSRKRVVRHCIIAIACEKGRHVCRICFPKSSWQNLCHMLAPRRKWLVASPIFKRLKKHGVPKEHTAPCVFCQTKLAMSMYKLPSVNSPYASWFQNGPLLIFAEKTFWVLDRKPLPHPKKTEGNKHV